MIPSSLKPVQKLLVYDLVREAGLDVSDWANYKKSTIPAANPRYCYDWAFEGDNRVVLCLWHGELRFEDKTVFQNLNYRTITASRRHWSSTQRKRAERMDHAIQRAKLQELPIRVIVVDGSRRGDADKAASKVERRLLDPVSWFVASYDDDGNCRLERSVPSIPLEPSEGEEISGAHRLARVAYNSSGWIRPTGEAGEHESDETYNAQNKFGHEDWLFRNEWVLDGWRYAFIQGLNKGRETYLGQSLDVTLYTRQPDKRRRLVATIYALESLGDKQAQEALSTFRAKGWLQIMQDEVKAIGGNAEALGAPEWAPNVLNVRFRLTNAELYPPDTFLPESEWMQKRNRYMLYKFGEVDRERVEKSILGRRGLQEAPNIAPLFRRGTKPIEFTPEHARMQTKLLEELQHEYGKQYVWLEKDFVDARVETDKELIFYEIKSDLDPRAVIRQALGQILEYAFHPNRTGRRPDRLVIVGRSKLSSEDEIYLKGLREKFHLPLKYRVIVI
jgi:hypothetical protein